MARALMILLILIGCTVKPQREPKTTAECLEMIKNQEFPAYRRSLCDVLDQL